MVEGESVQIDERGKELFTAMQDAVCNLNLDGSQTICATIELLVWILLATYKGDEKLCLERFEGLIEPMREGIKSNAPFIQHLNGQMQGNA